MARALFIWKFLTGRLSDLRKTVLKEKIKALIYTYRQFEQLCFRLILQAEYFCFTRT
jgi:hypothetical protein